MSMFASLLPFSVLGDFAYPQPVELGEGFRLGVASAPAHAEDQLNDAWLEFCRAGHCHAWLDVPRAEERLRLWSEPEVELDIAAALNVTAMEIEMIAAVLARYDMPKPSR